MLDNKRIIVSSFLIIALSIAYYFVVFLPNKHKAEQESLVKNQIIATPSPSLTPTQTPIPTPALSTIKTQLLSPTPNPCSKYDPKEVGKKIREEFPDAYKGLSNELLGDIFLKKFLGC